MCIYVCVYIYIYVERERYIYIYTYIYIYIYVYVYIYTYIYVYVYVYVYVYMYMVLVLPLYAERQGLPRGSSRHPAPGNFEASMGGGYAKASGKRRFWDSSPSLRCLRLEFMRTGRIQKKCISVVVYRLSV